MGYGTIAANDADERPAPVRKPYKFTKGAREAFLTHLAATAHVEGAAAAAGVCDVTAYAYRQRDSHFAQEWRVALLAGYDRIEAALIRKALGQPHHAPVVDCAETGTDPGPGELDVHLALVLLARHKPTVERAAKAAIDVAFRATRDSAEATLLAKLQAYAKRAGAAEAAEAAEVTLIGHAHGAKAGA